MITAPAVFNVFNVKAESHQGRETRNPDKCQITNQLPDKVFLFFIFKYSVFFKIVLLEGG